MSSAVWRKFSVKRLYDFLHILLCSCVGVFLGSSFFTFWHYRTYPELYAMQSAPWYLSIQTQAVFLAATVVIVLLLRWAIRRRMGK